MELHFYIPTPRGWELVPSSLQQMVIQAIQDTGYIQEGDGAVARVLETFNKIMHYEAMGDVLREVTNYTHLTTTLMKELLTTVFRHLNANITLGEQRYVYLELKESVKTTFLYTGVILFDPTI